NAAASLTATFTPENNTPPTISQLADQEVAEDTALGPLAFVVGDAESQLSDLSVTAASSDPDLVPVANITLAGTTAERTVSITPGTDKSGVVVITLTVSD